MLHVCPQADYHEVVNGSGYIGEEASRTLSKCILHDILGRWVIKTRQPVTRGITKSCHLRSIYVGLRYITSSNDMAPNIPLDDMRLLSPRSHKRNRNQISSSKLMYMKVWRNHVDCNE